MTSARFGPRANRREDQERQRQADRSHQVARHRRRIGHPQPVANVVLREALHHVDPQE